MRGVLLVNMGSPTSQKEMKQFLYNMFNDFAIIPLPSFIRSFVAFMISSSRYKKSWKKYELIGGSPLKTSMKSINEDLSKVLGNDFEVYTAYSYSNPLIKEGLEYFKQKGITEIDVIPLYPQRSFSTTQSVKTEIEKLKTYGLKINLVERFFNNENFIKYWQSNIKSTISENNFYNPMLLFSAHSIPEYHVKAGDKYVQEVVQSAKLISKDLNLEHKVSFQSGMGKVNWVKPDTKIFLKDLKTKGHNRIVIIPISFINENLETLYDLDFEIVPFAKNELNIDKVCRAKIPNSHPLLVEALKDVITK